MKRIYGCIYVHFEAISSLTRNEQMRCSKAFRGNANGAKYTLHNKQIYGCIYVHFEAISSLTRIEQMRCSKAFRGNANDAKYTLHNKRSEEVTSALPRTFQENMIRPIEVKKKCP